MLEFLVYAWLAGVLLAGLVGPLGCVLVWRQMAYFGDTLAHGAILGVVIGALSPLSWHLALLVSSLWLALLLWWLQRRPLWGMDTLLGIVSHGILALGVLLLAALEIPFNLEALLFGDILTVTQRDLGYMLGLVLICGALLVWQWRPLVAVCVEPELAAVEGISVKRVEVLLLVLLASVVAIAVKLVGVLLITALMIIPAATARFYSQTPQQMAWVAALLAGVAVTVGLGLSYWQDWPATPSIVVSALAGFVLSLGRGR